METEDKAVAQVREVFLALVKALVNDEEAVLLTVETIGAETVFHFSVAKFDLGKIIGKQGRNAGALRVLLVAAGRKYKHRFELEINAKA